MQKAAPPSSRRQAPPAPSPGRMQGYQPGQIPSSRDYYPVQNSSYLNESNDMSMIHPAQNIGNPQMAATMHYPVSHPVQGTRIPIYEDEDDLETGLEILAGMRALYVKQQLELLEALTGCETENRYKVYEADDQLHRKKQVLFKCKERSNWLTRNLLSGDCRPFTMRVLHADEDDDESSSFLKIEREFRCTCCCLNRPDFKVTWTEGRNDKFLGRITHDWAICDMTFEVLNSQDSLRYKVVGDGFQCGLFFNCPCDPCKKIVFNIYDANGQQVGEIMKVFEDMAKEFFSDADTFVCRFPPMATAEDKALLLANILFIDYRYFEENPSDTQPATY